ncbi:dipeptide ABC transporter ATP-binding protein [Agromyces albus]|uniref:ABC transporter ATP-binding protein n=1 Tax=Agromyces albus TaxID=205332 RepID=A0A4V1QXQ1_9MICO|nr:ABC transporter ATP-binding protein [Agromyces albus]RXZ70436.1 ABC transporter ATP-binding protein [Agromyces albus]
MTEPTPDALLRVAGLGVEFDVDGQRNVAVEDVSFEIGRNEVLALVGESGSGKSMTAMSLLGLLPRNATVTGSAMLDGQELIGLDPKGLREVRGSRVAMIFQDPLAALNPVLTIGFQIAEAVRLHDRRRDRAAVRARVIELLRLVEIADPETRLGQYPHQLSGGQCQRVVIAMALAGDPELLIADEPTTALDVTVQAEVLDVLRRMRGRLQSSILLITHDMGVVADLADRVAVMRRGVVVECDSAERLFAEPWNDYTRELLASVPRIGARLVVTERPSVPASARAITETADAATAPPREPAPVLDIDELVVEYRSRGRTVRAVDGVSLSVRRGEIVALVGESGSGKSTTGLASVGLAPVASGSIRISGRELKTAKGRELRELRQRVGVVFQNPTTSLNPRFSVRDAVAEPLRVHRRLRGRALDDAVDRLLDGVGLSGGWQERYPHELSGGQRQRVAIARAVALDPELLIADEPTSALDVSVQARVLDVFRELQERLGFACLFISHDLAVVDSLSDRIAVMQRGRIVEIGQREQVLSAPNHPYTRQLLDAAPVADPVAQRARREARVG